MSDIEDIKADPEQPTKLKNNKNVTRAFKLNGKNYPLCSRLMKVKIGGRETYCYIRNDHPEPVVFSWIVDNIENDIIADFAHRQTSKALWDSIFVMFDSNQTNISSTT